MYHAILESGEIIQYDTLTNSIKGNPMMVIHYKDQDGLSNWAGKNWCRIFSVFDNRGLLNGYSTGGWNISKEWKSEMAFSPCVVYYEVKDPSGQIRELKTNSTSIYLPSVINEVLTLIKEIRVCDSWKSFDILQENQRLKVRIKELEKIIQNRADNA